MCLPRLLSGYGYTSANIGKRHFLPHANRDHREPRPDYGFDHLEISDEPGSYEDAYRAWVRRTSSTTAAGIQAPPPLQGQSLPPALATKGRAACGAALPAYGGALAEVRRILRRRLLERQRSLPRVWAIEFHGRRTRCAMAGAIQTS